MQPNLIVHADWGSDPKKRWMARARLSTEGRYHASVPELVGQAETLIPRLHKEAGQAGLVMLGFDFPIGLPLCYAKRANITDFLALLPRLGQGEWSEFYTVAERPHQINLRRPFYPRRPGGARQRHLLDGLGVNSIDDLRRRCDLPQPRRRAASPIFWTLGAQQAGKAALNGWQSVLGPAMRSEDRVVSIWPFSGPLFELFRPTSVVIAETYPAECYTHLGITFPKSRAGRKSGKRVQGDRQAGGAILLQWAAEAHLVLEPSLRTIIQNGFGSSAGGEDPFDAVVGLFGMLNVVLNRRRPGTPDNTVIRKIEGWILGLDQA